MSPSPLPDIVVKQLTSADVRKVRELHSSVLPVTYPSSFFQQLLLFPTRVCLVAYSVDSAEPTHVRPVAFISASIRWMAKAGLEQPHIEILTLGVLPAYQQRGLARYLIRCVYHYFRDSSNPARHLDPGSLIYANVATSNTSALSFYERMGMRISSDIIRNLYRTCAYGCRDGYLVVGSLASTE